MLVEEGDASARQAQTLPYAVAEHEAGIEHRDLGLGARGQDAVDADEDVVVARVADIVLRAGGGGGSVGHRVAAP